ncbi:hypothetical protein [Amycolatopsis sp. NPDC098790]
MPDTTPTRRRSCTTAGSPPTTTLGDRISAVEHGREARSLVCSELAGR